MTREQIKCSRCGSVERVSRADAWNVNIRQGVMVEVICPTCQTPMENVEAEVNLATIDYGPWGMRPKGGVSS